MLNDFLNWIGKRFQSELVRLLVGCFFKLKGLFLHPSSAQLLLHSNSFQTSNPQFDPWNKGWAVTHITPQFPFCNTHTHTHFLSLNFHLTFFLSLFLHFIFFSVCLSISLHILLYWLHFFQLMLYQAADKQNWAISL